MKKIIILLLIYQITGVFAQTIYIKDKTTLQALQGVGANNLRSDALGRIDIAGLKTGADSLVQFSREGYFTEILSLAAIRSAAYTVLMSEKSVEFGGFVVSASRFEEKSRDVAQQTAVLDKKQIEFYGQPNTADVLQQSGRVFVQKSQMGGGSITMRGFEANRVLMVVDGVRLNNAIYRGGHLQNVLSVDNNMLEKTELVFGPGSVVYGSDALGGVVHFYTKNPRLSTGSKPLIQAMAFTRYGTAMNQKTGHFDVNIGLRRFAFLSSVSISDFGDMRIGKNGIKGYESWGRRTFVVRRINGKDSMVPNADSFTQTPNAYRQWDLMQKVLFRPSRFFSHTLNLQHSNTGNVPRYDRLTELRSNGLPAQAEWYYGPQTRSMFSYALAVDKKTVAFEKANVVMAYQDVRESRHNRGFGSSKINRRFEKVGVYTINADFQKEISKGSELRYGAELAHNTVQSEAYAEHIETGARTAISTRYPDGGSQMRSMALYAAQSIYFSERVILNTGIRFTNTYLKSVFNDKTFFPFLFSSIEQNNRNTSGNLGLVYLGKNDLKISATLASGFRAPNVDDMGKVFESTGGRVIVPNASLKPEQTTNVDVTVNKSFRKKLNIEINGYYTRFSNALSLGRTQLNGRDSVLFSGVSSAVYSVQNITDAYIYGGFAGLNYDLNKKISFSGNVNYTCGRIITEGADLPLDHISPVFGRFGALYKHRKWKAEAYTEFNGAKASRNYNLNGEDNALYSADPLNGFTPAWYTLNLRAYYQINKMFQVQCSAENLMDKHYRTFSSGYSAPGRNLILTLRGNF